MRLLDNLRASGSEGSAIRSHNCEISAVRTERFGSFLNIDFEPKVAASLQDVVTKSITGHKGGLLPEKAKTAISFGKQLWREKHFRRCSKSQVSELMHGLYLVKLNVTAGRGERFAEVQIKWLFYN